MEKRATITNIKTVLERIIKQCDDDMLMADFWSKAINEACGDNFMERTGWALDPRDDQRH